MYGLEILIHYEENLMCWYLPMDRYEFLMIVVFNTILNFIRFN